jgi:hypothetical protein
VRDGYGKVVWKMLEVFFSEFDLSGGVWLLVFVAEIL